MHAPRPRAVAGPIATAITRFRHLVVDRTSLPLGPLAVVLPATADGRLAVAVPWGTQVLLGTTDTPYEDAWAMGPGAWVTATQAAASALGLSTPVATHLAAIYGAAAAAVLALVAQQPRLGHPLVPGLPYLRAEVVHAARQAGAQTLQDVLRRRTRAALEDREGGLSVAPDAADLLAAELGWDAARRQRELDAYCAHIAAARRA